MSTTRRHHLGTATAATAATALTGLALLAATSGPSFADDSHARTLLEADLVGSSPAPASPTVAGVRPGAAPWVDGPSTARVRPDGRVSVTITGLVIPTPVGTGTNPIASVVATVVCDDTVRASTAPFPLSSAGDGATSDRVALHGRCTDPAVLVQPAANRAVYIASSTGGSADD
jgi:hypothetical protein